MNDPISTLLTAAILAAQARSEDMKKAAEDAAQAYAAGWAAYGVASRQIAPQQKAAEHSGVCGDTGPAETCNCRNAMTA